MPKGACFHKAGSSPGQGIHFPPGERNRAIFIVALCKNRSGEQIVIFRVAPDECGRIAANRLDLQAALAGFIHHAGHESSRGAFAAQRGIGLDVRDHHHALANLILGEGELAVFRQFEAVSLDVVDNSTHGAGGYLSAEARAFHLIIGGRGFLVGGGAGVGIGRGRRRGGRGFRGGNRHRVGNDATGEGQGAGERGDDGEDKEFHGFGWLPPLFSRKSANCSQACLGPGSTGIAKRRVR